jgi:hypothetical protein
VTLGTISHFYTMISSIFKVVIQTTVNSHFTSFKSFTMIEGVYRKRSSMDKEKVRLTIDIPKDLRQKAKAYAALHNLSMRGLIVMLLQKLIEEYANQE